MGGSRNPLHLQHPASRHNSGVNTSATLTLRDRWSLYLDLIRWDRPQGWLLLLWPTLAALWIAAQGFPGWHLLTVFTVGTILMRSAGCAVNDFADKDIDRHVERTAQRPLTSGRISVKEVVLIGVVLALASFALVLTTNAYTVALSFGALAVTILYPFTKRFFAMPQAVLGVAYSFGIPMAFTAVLNDIPPVAWWLLAGKLAWVIAYDTEYAMVDRNDDLKIGVRTSAITLGRFDVLGVMVLYTVCLACWWQAGRLAGLGWLYNVALLVATAQALHHYLLIKGRERLACFKAFRLNHWLGLTVWVGVAADLAWCA